MYACVRIYAGGGGGRHLITYSLMFSLMVQHRSVGERKEGRKSGRKKGKKLKERRKDGRKKERKRRTLKEGRRDVERRKLMECVSYLKGV
jgi:hypothetical protein